MGCFGIIGTEFDIGTISFCPKTGIDEFGFLRIHQYKQCYKVKQEIPKCPVNEKNVLVKIGNPVKKIVSTAEKGAYDLVIMGTHGHGKFEEAIIGSVASEVIRTSSVPVLVVRLPENKK